MKNKELDKIIEAHPNLRGNSNIANLAEALDEIKDKKNFILSEGGKKIAKALKDQTDSLLLDLRAIYKTATKDELVAVIASYDAQIQLFESFREAVKLEKLIQDDIDKEILGD